MAGGLFGGREKSCEKRAESARERKKPVYRCSRPIILAASSLISTNKTASCAGWRLAENHIFFVVNSYPKLSSEWLWIDIFSVNSRRAVLSFKINSESTFNFCFCRSRPRFAPFSQRFFLFLQGNKRRTGLRSGTCPFILGVTLSWAGRARRSGKKGREWSEMKPSTVAPLHNGHLGDRSKWPL